MAKWPRTEKQSSEWAWSIKAIFFLSISMLCSCFAKANAISAAVPWVSHHPTYMPSSYWWLLAVFTLWDFHIWFLTLPEVFIRQLFLVTIALNWPTVSTSHYALRDSRCQPMTEEVSNDVQFGLRQQNQTENRTAGCNHVSPWGFDVVLGESLVSYEDLYLALKRLVFLSTDKTTIHFSAAPPLLQSSSTDLLFF